MTDFSVSEIIATMYAAIQSAVVWVLIKSDSWVPDALKMVVPFLLGLFADPLRQRLVGPKLRIDFGHEETFVSTSPEIADDGEPVEAVGGGQSQIRLVRVCILNKRRAAAKNCRAYLVGIEKDRGNGYESVGYRDSLQLRWSCRQPGEDGFIGVDLPKNVSQCVDVAATFSDLTRSYLYAFVRVLPGRYKRIFETPGRFRLTISVAGDGCPPLTRRICIAWEGTWDSLNASR